MYLHTLKTILSDMGLDDDLLTDDAYLRKDLQLDSTETVEVALQIKRQLGISIKLEARQDLTLTQVTDKIAEAAAAVPT